MSKLFILFMIFYGQIVTRIIFKFGEKNVTIFQTIETLKTYEVAPKKR